MSRVMPWPARWPTNLLSGPPVSSWPDLGAAEASRAFTAGVASWTRAVEEFSRLQSVTLRALAGPWTASPGAATAAVESKDMRSVAEARTGGALVEDRAVTDTDDIDGSEAAECVAFALDGREYEITLSEVNAARLRVIFAPFVAAAQPAGRRPRKSGPLNAQRARPGSLPDHLDRPPGGRGRGSGRASRPPAEQQVPEVGSREVTAVAGV